MRTRKYAIEEYQCGECGRVFYVDPRERTALDLEFGCCFGCDDTGNYTGIVQISEEDVI